MPYELKAALGKVTKAPKNFSVFTGQKGSQVLIGSAAPSTAQLTEMHTKVGNTNKAVLTGVCFRDPEEGFLIFATKAGPPSTMRTPIFKAMSDGKCVVKFD